MRQSYSWIYLASVYESRLRFELLVTLEVIVLFQIIAGGLMGEIPRVRLKRNFWLEWWTCWTLTMNQMHKESFPWLMSGQILGNTHHTRTYTHTHTSAGEKDRAYFNGLSCCQNVWYALATDSSGIAGSTVCVCMRVYACEQRHTNTLDTLHTHSQKHSKKTDEQRKLFPQRSKHSNP